MIGLKSTLHLFIILFIGCRQVNAEKAKWHLSAIDSNLFELVSLQISSLAGTNVRQYSISNNSAYDYKESRSKASKKTNENTFSGIVLLVDWRARANDYSFDIQIDSIGFYNRTLHPDSNLHRELPYLWTYSPMIAAMPFMDRIYPLLLSHLRRFRQLSLSREVSDQMRLAHTDYLLNTIPFDEYIGYTPIPDFPLYHHPSHLNTSNKDSILKNIEDLGEESAYGGSICSSYDFFYKTKFYWQLRKKTPTIISISSPFLLLVLYEYDSEYYPLLPIGYTNTEEILDNLDEINKLKFKIRTIDHLLNGLFVAFAEIR